MFETFAGLPLYKHSLNALQENQLAPLVIATNASLYPRFDYRGCAMDYRTAAPSRYHFLPCIIY
ncbi:hypothetical protein AABM34_14480 [Lysinibacillus fusiformis]